MVQFEVVDQRVVVDVVDTHLVRDSKATLQTCTKRSFTVYSLRSRKETNAVYYSSVRYIRAFFTIQSGGEFPHQPFDLPHQPLTQFSCPTSVLPFWERTVDLLWVNNWMNWYHNKFAFRIISSVSSSHFVIFMPFSFLSSHLLKSSSRCQWCPVSTALNGWARDVCNCRDVIETSKQA